MSDNARKANECVNEESLMFGCFSLKDNIVKQKRKGGWVSCQRERGFLAFRDISNGTVSL